MEATSSVFRMRVPGGCDCGQPAGRRERDPGRSQAGCVRNRLDLGRIAPGRKASVQVVVRNTGNKALDIRKIRTTLSVPDRDVAAERSAGGQAAVRFEFTPPSVGEVIEEEAVLYSNDPEKPVTLLEFSGSVGSAIRVLPEGIAVPGVRRADLPKVQFSSVQLTSSWMAPLSAEYNWWPRIQPSSPCRSNRMTAPTPLA